MQQITTQQVKKDPVLLQRELIAVRRERMREVCNNLLAGSEQNTITRRDLYEECLIEGVIPRNWLSQFGKELKYLENHQFIHSQLIKADGKNRDRMKIVFMPQHLRQIMKQIIEMRSPMSYKVQIAIQWLLGLKECLRSSEVAALQWFNVRSGTNQIIVADSKSKNRANNKFGEGKTQPIPLFPDVKKVLLMYKKMLGASDTDYLFISPKDPNTHLASKTIFGRFERVLDSVGLREKHQLIRPARKDKNGRVDPDYQHRFHTNRHTGIFYWLLIKKNKGYVQQIARHRSIDTTDEYATLLTDTILKGCVQAENSNTHRITTVAQIQKLKQDLLDMIEENTQEKASGLHLKHQMSNETVRNKTNYEQERRKALEMELEVLKRKRQGIGEVEGVA